MATTKFADIERRAAKFAEWQAGRPKTVGDVDEFEGAEAWVRKMKACPSFGIGGGKGYEQDWMVMEDLLGRFPFHTTAVCEYQMFLFWWLPRIFTGYTFEHCGGSERHVFEFKQIRYFRPTRTTPEGTVCTMSLDDAASTRNTLCAHVMVDIVHTRHFYAKTDTLVSFTLRDDDDGAQEDQNRSSHVPVRGRLCFLQHFGGAVGLQQDIADDDDEDDDDDDDDDDDNNNITPLQVAISGPGVEAFAPFNARHAGLEVVCLVARTSDHSILIVDAMVKTSDTRGVEALLHDHERLLHATRVAVSYQVPLVDVPLMTGAFSHVPGFGDLSDYANPAVGALTVNGNAQQVTDQIQLAINEAFVFPGKKGQWRYSCECRSLNHRTPFNSTSTLAVHLTAANSVVVHIPRVATPSRTKSKTAKPIDVPMAHLLVFLGVDSPDAFRAATAAVLNRLPGNLGVWLHTLVADTSFEGLTLASVRALYSSALGKSPTAVEEHVLAQFLPHCNTVASKLHYFVAILTRFAFAVVLKKCDDRDAQVSTLVAGPGSTVALLYRQLARKWDGKMTKLFERALAKRGVLNAALVADYNARCGAATYHIKTAHFSVTSANAKQGSTQTRVMGTSNLATRAQLAMNNKTLNKKHKHKGPRAFKQDGFGKCCPVTTPEGPPTGLSNSQPLSTHLSRGIDVAVMSRIVLALPGVLSAMAEPPPPPQPQTAPSSSAAAARTVQWNRLASVYVNGHLVGRLARGVTNFLRVFRETRRRGVIPYCASVAEDVHGCVVRCGPGRILTPYYVATRAADVDAVLREELSGNNPHTPDRLRGATLPGGLITRLGDRGVVEWLDSHEQRGKWIAVSRNKVEVERPAVLPEGQTDWEPTTHALIVEASVLSPTAAIIPWTNCNQTPRGIYFIAQFKAAMGFNDPRRPQNRVPAKVFSICCPQRALVRTRYEEVVRTHFYRESAYSQSLVVLWATLDFVIEDAIIVAKGAVERGVGMHYEYTNQSFVTQDKHVIFQKPTETTILRKLGSEKCYAAIGDDGLPVVGAYVRKGDVILGRVRPIHSVNGQGEEIVRYRCCSEVSRSSGFVSHVAGASPSLNMGRVVTVQLREHCYLKSGDKLSNRHGQKGCVSLVIPDVDLPFTAEGIRPDIVVNPHSFTSRMTAACILEALGGKAAAVAGESFVDATAWTDPVAAGGRFRRALADAGYHPMGYDKFYSGTTGQPMEGNMFMGPVNTLFLWHKVKNKAYARGRRGPVNRKTRQPEEGRAKKGGPRLGEMEGEVLQQHGAAHFRQELSNLSDPHLVYICKQCKLLVAPPPVAGLQSRPGNHTSTATAERAGDYRACGEGHLCHHCGMDAVVMVEGTWSTYGMLIPTMTSLNIKTEFEVQPRQDLHCVT
jgi:DNA-directed RNA polymerase subunit B